MKKFVVLAVVGLLAVGSVFAASGTGSNLTVNASVAPVLSATFTGGPDGTIAFTSLSGTGTKYSSEATLTIVSNYPHWTVTFASQNASLDKGKLKDPAGVAASLPYNLKAVLATSGWTNSTNVVNGIDDYQPMATNRTIGVTSGNGKTFVSGADYTITASLDMPSGSTEMFEQGITFTDTILVSISAP